MSSPYLLITKNYKPVELKWVTDAITETQRRLDVLSTELHDDKSWKRGFQEALENQNKQIDKILEGLREEKEARKEEDTSIKSRMDSLSNNIAIFRSGWLIVALFVAAILGGLAEYIIPKLFERH